MSKNLSDFAEHVNRAPTSKRSERIVRIMLEELAEDCPMHVLVQLGQCIVNCRKAELKDQAERN